MFQTSTRGATELRCSRRQRRNAYASATFDSAMQLWNDTLNTTTETMYVGRDSASTDRNFGGLMDDMAWYSDMLNQSQLDNVREWHHQSDGNGCSFSRHHRSN